ncbi:MAG: PTS mannose transporter subunit IIA [Erysipelotrichaceae bacterium]|nr:PTS mannose transporter subunit IIA [Erysipelotrichaceae bacterium]
MEFNILLMSHGDSAKAILSSSEMIVGKSDHIQAISLMPGMSVETLIDEAKRVLDSNTGETLIMTDLYGGTPSNVALMLTQQYKVKVITGLNLAMLLETLIVRQNSDNESLDQILESLVTTAKDACRQVVLEER